MARKGFASHSYTKNLGAAQKHIQYIAFRDRENLGEKPGLFNETSNNADVKTFQSSLKDKLTANNYKAKAHKILFSMSGDEWNRSNFEAGDYQKMIRRIMKEYEIQTGKRLTWVAAEHRNPDHPHVHAVIKATYQDRYGTAHILELKDKDRLFFKEEFQRQKNQLRGFELEPPKRDKQKEFEQQNEKPKLRKSSAVFLDSLFEQFQARMLEEERKRQFEQER